jgi:TRAP-type transport system small permease protein
MTITELIDKLGGRRREIADALVDLIALTVLGSLVWFGARLVAAGWSNELTVLQIPMSVQYLGMPIGCSAMAVWVGWDLWRIARGDSRAARWGA